MPRRMSIFNLSASSIQACVLLLSGCSIEVIEPQPNTEKQVPAKVNPTEKKVLVNAGLPDSNTSGASGVSQVYLMKSCVISGNRISNSLFRREVNKAFMQTKMACALHCRSMMSELTSGLGTLFEQVGCRYSCTWDNTNIVTPYENQTFCSKNTPNPF